jgi:hypothetical protein
MNLPAKCCKANETFLFENSAHERASGYNPPNTIAAAGIDTSTMLWIKTWSGCEWPAIIAVKISKSRPTIYHCFVPENL